ncbi:MAG TPA: hypothetical protein VHV83_11895 [Armatimonadota bacterium]|nr:hypothetical protein [Armatimonadota bacterium]
MQKHLLRWFGITLGIATLAALMIGCSDVTTHSSLNGNTVTINIKTGDGQAIDPAYLAFQDGNHAWRKITLNGNGHYTFQVTNIAKKYGVAIVDRQNNTMPNVIYATTNELADIPYTLLNNSTSGFSISGNVTGSNGERTIVCCGGKVGVAPGDAAYNLTNVGDGNHLLLACRMPNSPNIPDSYVLKNISVGSGDTGDCNINYTNDSITPRNLTVTKPSGTVEGSEWLWLADNNLFIRVGENSGGITDTYAALPTTAPTDGILYDYALTWNNGSSYETYRRTPSNVDLSSISLPTMAAPTIDNDHTTCSWSKFNAAKLYTVQMNGIARQAIYLTAGWLGASASYTLALPNFSALSSDGWNSNWAPSTITSVVVAAITLNAPTENYFKARMGGEYYDGYTISKICYGNTP